MAHSTLSSLFAELALETLNNKQCDDDNVVNSNEIKTKTKIK